MIWLIAIVVAGLVALGLHGLWPAVRAALRGADEEAQGAREIGQRNRWGR